MTEPERPINTSHAFCSLLIPGLGQLLQKRPGAAVGFFVLFIVAGMTPVCNAIIFISELLPHLHPLEHFAHIFVFGVICFPLIVAIFISLLDAATWKQGDRIQFKPMIICGTLCLFVMVLCLPALSAYREAAKRMLCGNNMRQMIEAFHHYHHVHGRFPPVYSVDKDGQPLHSWRVLILPYYRPGFRTESEYQGLYDQIRLDEPWDSEHNRQFHAEALRIFQCPSYSHPRDVIPAPGGTFYSAIYGKESTRSGSQIFLVERRTPVNWMDPSREIPFATAIKGINVDAMGISSYHSGGINVALGDGSVRFITDTIDHETLRALLTVDSKDSQ